MTSIKMNEDKELARRSDSTVVNIDNNHDNSNQRCQETENPELVMLVTGKEIPRDGSDPERAIPHSARWFFMCKYSQHLGNIYWRVLAKWRELWSI